MTAVNFNDEDPAINVSSKTDDKIKAIQKTGYDIKYQEGLIRYLDIRYALNSVINKAYAILYASFCNKVMQSQLEEHPNFKLKYKYNPIETLEAIKTMIHDLAIAQ